jgi:hypothetical protein
MPGAAASLDQGQEKLDRQSPFSQRAGIGLTGLDWSNRLSSGRRRMSRGGYFLDLR